jgi:hypothetical protein
MEGVMAQLLDFYVSSTGGMTARFENGEARSVSNRELFSILQNAKVPGSVRAAAAGPAPVPSSLSAVRVRTARITLSRSRTVSVLPAELAA